MNKCSARQVFSRAAGVAEQGGDLLRAAHAHLTLIEETRERILLSELARHYEATNRVRHARYEALQSHSGAYPD